MIASFLHLPTYDGHFGYPKKFPKKKKPKTKTQKKKKREALRIHNN
jgi:hypothetical protein